ncbi:hypothetical protein [uncultured Methanobrevibacter sp.]
MSPRRESRFSVEPKIKRPATTPIRQKGIVERIRRGCLNFSN